MNSVPSDLPMQRDVLSIFTYFNDRIAPAEMRIQMGKPDRHLDRYQRRAIQIFHLCISPALGNANAIPLRFKISTPVLLRVSGRTLISSANETLLTG
jgi:hypothetical protein